MPPGMHSYVANLVLSKLNKENPEKFSLSEDQKEAFLQGNDLADIGRFFLDFKTKIDSDGEKFISAIKSLAKTPEEIWFARGLEMHRKVDLETNKILKDIFGEPKWSFDYLSWYGILGNYVIKKTGEYINLPSFNNFSLDQLFGALPSNKGKSLKFSIIKIFGKFALFLIGGPGGAKKYFLKNIKRDHMLSFKHNKLIKKAYLQAANYNVSYAELEKQITNMVGASLLLCVKERNHSLDDTLVKKIDIKIDNLVNKLAKELILNIKK